MTFDVPADAYLGFMGRYSAPLAERFVDLVPVRRGDRVLDVGCGPGVLRAPLVERCGPAWWTPYLDGVGRVGSYVAALGADHVARLE
jgi:trans-aconitate methyltransferase